MSSVFSCRWASNVQTAPPQLHFTGQTGRQNLPGVGGKVDATFQPYSVRDSAEIKFNTRIRKPGEPVSTYLAELQSLAECCDYRTSLEAMLRNRLVCSIDNEKIQQHLLAEGKLTYAKELEMAQGLETAA